MRSTYLAVCLAGSSLLIGIAAIADSGPQGLVSRIQAGTTCELVPNNGKHCSYRVPKILDLSIKDVGGPDTVIAFNASDVNNELYAVVYQSCIAVVPGQTYKGKSTPSTAAFISPVTGQVYSSLTDCKGASK